jgi:undecaprenyl-diphosphatase
VGILLDDWVNEHFYNAYTVAVMLILYGVIFIIMERRNRKKAQRLMESGELSASRETLAKKDPAYRGRHARVELEHEEVEAEELLFKIRDVDEIDWKTALKIGCFQVLAIIPGTSRSGATIIGGMLCGCSRTAAAEYTFFLAIPIMFGWGVVKAAKFMLEGLVMTSTEIMVLAIGVVSAFIMSVISIRFLMGYIKKNDFTAFGIYRIIVGIVVLAFFTIQGAGLVL